MNSARLSPFALVALAAFLLPSLASAGDFGATGLYVRGGLVIAADATTISPFVSTGVGIGGAVGYRFRPHFAIEGQVEWQGDSDVLNPFDGSTAGTISRADATANLKVYLLTGRFQPYGVAGIGWGRFATSCGPGCPTVGADNGFLARLGGGFDIYITEMIGVYAEAAYMATAFDVQGTSLAYGTAGAGVVLRFPSSD